MSKRDESGVRAREAAETLPAWTPLGPREPPAPMQPYGPERQAELIASGRLRMPTLASPLPPGCELLALDAGEGNEGRFFTVRRTSDAGATISVRDENEP